MISRASPTLIVTRIDHRPQDLFSALDPNPPPKRQQTKRQTNQLRDTTMSRTRKKLKTITAAMVVEIKVALWAYKDEELSLTKHPRTKGR